ncbi:MAG TPA: ABC transporter substrate-binding protein [Acetobacteraceae bacterium]|nr:ABC transporter substrate-binding protein [Acetobacteraceae bacterium]
MSLTRRLLIGSSLAASMVSSARAADGVVRIGISTSLNTLDPLMTSTGDEYIFDNICFNGLTRMREDLVVVPDLAESWSFTEDLKRWTFKLRRGVKFHNGEEMVADDVVAMFRRLLDPKVAAPARSQYDMVDTVSAPDPATVVFELKVPYSGLADVLTDRQAKITPRSAVAQMATKPIGTGAFKFVSYTPGDRVVMTRNPDYFDAGLPKIAGAELRIIPEISVRIAALQAGDIDILWDLPLEQVKDFGKQSGLRAESIPTASWDGAVMNNLNPPFNNLKVRQAFHLGVDKRDLVELTLFGQGLPTLSPIPPTHPFYAKDVVIPQADPVAARKMLAEAGHPDGIKMPMIVPIGRPLRERLGVSLQQLLKPAGFDLQIQRVPYSSFSAEVSGKAPLYIDGFFARPTVDTSTFPFLHTGASWNEQLWHYSNPDVDKALETARTSGDVNVQKTSYIAMQKALAAVPPGMFAYVSNFACAFRSNVGGVHTHPMRWFDLRNATLS